MPRNLFVLVVIMPVFLLTLYGFLPPAHAVLEDNSTSTFDARYQGWTSDPISSSVGEYYFKKPLFHLGGPMPLFLNLYYASRIEKGAGLHNDPFGGDDFTHNYHIALWRRDADTIRVMYTGGNFINFVNDGGWQVRNEEIGYELQEGQDHYYLMDPIAHYVYTFEKATVLGGSREVGILTRIDDRNGNTLTLTNQAAGAYIMLARIQDGLGRWLDFTYIDPNQNWNYPHLETVTDQAGRTVRFTYEITANSIYPTAVTDALGETTTFQYTQIDNNRIMVSQTLPLANIPYAQAYTQAPDGWNWRADNQTDAFNHTTHLDYGDDTGETTITYPQGETEVHTHGNRRLLTRIVDQRGKTAAFGYDDRNRRTVITDRLGGVTRLTYHDPTGNLASFSDAEGRLTTFTYGSQEQALTIDAAQVAFTFYNLSRIVYADGSHVDYVRDAKGNVIAFIDQMGREWGCTRNPRGQALTFTNPEGGVITYTYNADGTLASQTDSDETTGTITYTHEPGFKRPSKITYPGDSSEEFAYNANNSLLSHINENGAETSLVYDANQNLDNMTDALNQTHTYEQDAMDRLKTITDPDGQTVTLTYDELGRLKTRTDRRGNTTTRIYNPRGWLMGIRDHENHQWSATYDDEGVPASVTTPLGFTSAFDTDRLGNITRLTDPLDHSAFFTYDAVGRQIGFTNRLGHSLTNVFDDNGRLVSVRDPILGDTAYTYNSLGQVTGLVDLAGNTWRFGYSAMGRWTSFTDPLGNPWGFKYDARGRLGQIVRPGQSTIDYTYDAAGNPVRIDYPDGPTVANTFDGQDRLLTTNDLVLTYDRRGDIVASQDGSATFGATYNPARLVKTVTYDGLVTVTYTYDTRNLLTRVEDDRAGAWLAFTHDADRRLTRIERSNGVNTVYAYDHAARITRIHDLDGNLTLADQRFTLNARGIPTRVEFDLPQASPAAAAGGQSHTFDDAGQVSAAGNAYDPFGRRIAAPGKTFTYDGADQLTAVTDNTVSAAFTYNGLGDLRTRTHSGTTTTYHYNYALGLDPLVAEATGGYDRFYVYTPRGSLLYALDPTTSEVRFYHFDRTGSTLFLTDGATGAVQDTYLYDPYGRLTLHEGASTQPFTWVGRFGVRRETVGGLYHMRARYYDPQSAHFLTRDTHWPRLSNPRSLAPYVYAGMNPISNIDPMGTQEFESELQEWVIQEIVLAPFEAPFWAPGEEYQQIDDPDDPKRHNKSIKRHQIAETANAAVRKTTPKQARWGQAGTNVGADRYYYIPGVGWLDMQHAVSAMLAPGNYLYISADVFGTLNEWAQTAQNKLESAHRKEDYFSNEIGVRALWLSNNSSMSAGEALQYIVTNLEAQHAPEEGNGASWIGLAISGLQVADSILKLNNSSLVGEVTKLYQTGRAMVAKGLGASSPEK